MKKRPSDLSNASYINITHRHHIMNGWMTVFLLVISNAFMTFAWYGQLKLGDMGIVKSSTPLWIIILGSWGIALLEYIFMVPANRYGFIDNGGQFSLLQLKVIQEVISLGVFTIFAVLFFRNESFQWNHFLAFGLLIAAVYLVFMKS